MASKKAKSEARVWVILALDYMTVAGRALRDIAGMERDGEATLASVLPVFWNIKHSIELLLKSILVDIVDSYDAHHDIEDLLKSVKNEVSRKKWNIDLGKYEDLIRKYYTVTFLQGRITKFITVFDKDNDLLRYPESTARLSLDWGRLDGESVSNKELEEIVSDVEILLEFRRKISEAVNGTDGKE